MSQLDFMLKHSVLARLDATIEHFDDVVGKLNATENKADSQMRRNQFLLLQTRQEILNVREAAVATLTRLNTFGATLEIMAQPEIGVDRVVEDVMKWYILLTECDRAFLMLRDEKNNGYLTSIVHEWVEAELRAEERTVSEAVLDKVRKTRDIFSSSNMDMASTQYQKSGSWRIPLRTVIGIPMVVNEQIIGIFYGDRKITSGTLSQDMLPLFKLYAAQAAIAIHNSQLFAKLTEK